jgi:hypothetical protein
MWSLLTRLNETQCKYAILCETTSGETLCVPYLSSQYIVLILYSCCMLSTWTWFFGIIIKFQRNQNFQKIRDIMDDFFYFFTYWTEVMTYFIQRFLWLLMNHLKRQCMWESERPVHLTYQCAILQIYPIHIFLYLKCWDGEYVLKVKILTCGCFE